MAIKTYNPDNVSVVVAGRVLTNLADSFVKVNRKEASWTPTVAVDGNVTRNYNNNRMGSVEVTLKASSDDNLFMSSLLAADELGGLGTFTILIKDNNGPSFYSAAEAWIEKWADAEFAKEIGDRQWTIHCAELVMVNGGTD